MIQLSATQLLIIEEIVIVVLGVAGLIFFRLRKRYKRQIASKEEDVLALEEELQRIQAKYSELNANNERDANLEEKLRLSEAQVSNLQRFKKLYFELEEKLALVDTSLHERKIKKLMKEVVQQRDMIKRLQSQMAVEKEGGDIRLDAAREIDGTLAELHASNMTLGKCSNDLFAQHKTSVDDQRSTLTHLKERVAVLEQRERELKSALQKSEQQRQSGGVRAEAPVGVVKIREIEHLSHQLQAKENELRRLRQECQTIGRQYEDLAAKTLRASSPGSDAEQQQRLQELQTLLTNNTELLARKQAECEMLENSFLALSDDLEEGESKRHYKAALAEESELAIARSEVCKDIEAMSSDDSAEAIASLREQLEAKERELQQARTDYQELKAQFLEVAEEEFALKRDVQRMRREHQETEMELSDLKRTRDTTRAEYDELRKEYDRLENRFLKMMEKYSSTHEHGGGI